MTNKIKQGDLLPAWEATLTDGGTPVDLSTATGIRVIGARNGTIVIDEDVTGSAEGVVTFDWPAGSTDTAGEIKFEVEVTWPGSKPQTFPPSGTLRTTVHPDLDH